MARQQIEALIGAVVQSRNAQDARGHWRQRLQLVQQLQQAGTSPAVAQATAAAAVAVGQCIASRGRP